MEASLIIQMNGKICQCSSLFVGSVAKLTYVRTQSSSETRRFRTIMGWRKLFIIERNINDHQYGIRLC